MAPHARVAYLRSVEQRAGIGAGSLQLHQALAQLEVLQQALASSQQRAIAALQQVDLLTQTNTRLREIAVQREREVAEVRHFAYHDELTGLPNRALLRDRLTQALARARRGDKRLALLFLDLDRFKDTNDRLGHGVGDRLLQRVAERLLSCIRGGDTACRYGGDEFVVLLPEVIDRKHALDVAGKIRTRLARPYPVDGHSIAVTASIGVAVYPVDGTSQDDLIRQADIAMYLGKAVKSTS
jgi:diguanylate cyclase (GGDEF)-like protein